MDFGFSGDCLDYMSNGSDRTICDNLSNYFASLHIYVKAPPRRVMSHLWRGDKHDVRNSFGPSREHVDTDTTPRDDVPINGVEEKRYVEEREKKDLDLEKAASTPSHRAAEPLVVGPPPDGGIKAWTQVLMAHVIIFNTWGYINSFGLFQTYYVATLGHPPSDVSWIGSMQVFLLFFIGTVPGTQLTQAFSASRAPSASSCCSSASS
ncbi:hypothetical protein LTR66_008729 [Elasticomyces elasticus]|nr:hypothetical protein LTR66_008729 [Elasticomyces elasticus]